jgi:hypothetical protein
MAASEDVSLPDLQVIQRYSLAVRGATARRADVIAALRADLEWLTGTGRTARAATPRPAEPTAPARKAPAKKAPAKKAGTAATKSGARRG